MRIRRFIGLILMPAGAALLIGSLCPYLLAIADYFDIPELWGTTCPDALHIKLMLIGGVVIGVLGQRLYSGRDLRTGERPNAD